MRWGLQVHLGKRVHPRRRGVVRVPWAFLSFPPPYDLKVAAGRGKALVFELDQNGNRIRTAEGFSPAARWAAGAAAPRGRSRRRSDEPAVQSRTAKEVGAKSTGPW